MILLSQEKLRERLFERIRDYLDDIAAAPLTPAKQVLANQQCVTIFDELVASWREQRRMVATLGDDNRALDAENDRLRAALQAIAASSAFFGGEVAMRDVAIAALAGKGVEP